MHPIIDLILALALVFAVIGGLMALTGGGIAINGVIAAVKRRRAAKRAPKPEPRIHYVPAEHVREILGLWDAVDAAPPEARKVPQFDLWNRLYTLMPELREPPTEHYSHWQLKMKGSTHVLVEEVP